MGLELLPPITRLPSAGAGAWTFGNEAVAQVTTNPPSPGLDGVNNAQDGRYKRMSAGQRLLATNADAVKSMVRSWDTFIRHPLKNLVPILENGASSTIQPILHPLETIDGIKDYYRQKGVVDGTMQALYTASNVAGGLAIVALGAASVGTLVVGAPAAAVGGAALAGIELFSAANLVSNVGQFAFDEAQTAAPEDGLRFPRWMPVVGGKTLFKKTNHQQQVALLKFDILNTGGSALMLGFAKIGAHPEAPFSRKIASYAGLGATEAAIVSAGTPAG